MNHCNKSMAAENTRPLGPIVEGRSARHPSPDITLIGRNITIKPLSPSHADAFYPHISGEKNASLWAYMGDEPYTSLNQFRAAVTSKSQSTDPLYYAIILNTPQFADGRDNIVGWASHMRIDIPNRCIELGNLMYPPTLQRTPAATEVTYLLAKHAFEDLGFRRYEWKCNALNAPSRRAALRLGFTFEGVFRKHMVVKGRSRDTAWFSMTDNEWPAMKHGLEKWLDPSNFDEQGVQKERLEELRR
ncbi:putative acetyltransferase, GNAT family [Xylariaceae sp. FL1272]|nr:putative acetyltransferase, GNAT family [Xylariaceae sp. FL1272]